MKKIIAIISSCLVAVLLAVTITLACVKFTAVTVVNDGAMSIRVYKDSSEVTMEVKKNSDEYAKLYELYKESLKENADPRKWLCVEAEEVVVESIDNTVLFLMASSQEANAIKDAFMSLAEAK